MDGLSAREKKSLERVEEYEKKKLGWKLGQLQQGEHISPKTSLK